MYSTCIFCSSRLGANEVVEEFPVGRRVAFDPEKGRLWAICPRCRQWNLSPLEERWEALESLERTYRETPQRYGTDQIGLARHPEGLEMVRVGRPSRPEYAAWRYGAELLRRRRKAVIFGTAGVAGGALILGGMTSGLIVGAGVTLMNVSAQSFNLYRNVFRTAARVEGPDGSNLILKQRHAQRAHLHEEGGEWRLSFPYLLDSPAFRKERLGLWLRGGAYGVGSRSNDPVLTVGGRDAVRAAGKILPALNRSGASTNLVRDATRFVEETGTAEGAFDKARRTVPSGWRALTAPARSPQSALYRLPGVVRLGLEMAAQEETERRALEGELEALEREWREAEEVASIADDLLLPESVRRLLGRGE